KEKKSLKLGKTLPIIIGFLLIGSTGFAQDNQKTLEQLQQKALENNLGLRASELQTEEAKTLIGSAVLFDKTQVFYEYDENNLAVNDIPLDMFGVQQDIRFPTAYFAERKMNRQEYEVQNSRHELQIREINGKVAAAYYQYQYESNKSEIYRKLDSLYTNFAQAAERRFELGETNYLEKITAKSKQRQLETDYQKSKEDLEIALEQLKSIVQSKDSSTIERFPMERFPIGLENPEAHPATEYFENRSAYFQTKRKVEQQQLLPDISLSYALGSNSGLDKNLYKYQVGLKIPLFFGSNSSKIKASKIA